MDLVMPSMEVGNLLFWGGTVGTAILTFILAEPIKIVLVWLFNHLFKKEYEVTTLPRFWKLISPVPAAFAINIAVMLFENNVVWNQMPLKVIVSSALSVWAYNMFKPKIESMRLSGQLPS
jgi:hypothetical protein